MQNLTPDDRRLIRRQEAIEDCGMTAEQFEAAFRRLHGDQYVSREALLSAREHIVRTVRNADGEPVVGGMAASIMHGCRWYDDDFIIELIRHPTGSGRPGLGSRIHRTDLDATDVMVVDGIRVTTPIRTAFDLGRIAPEWRALGYLDDLVRATDFPIEELHVYAHNRSRRRRIRQLRNLIPLIDANAESPPESWVRLLMLRGDLPTPETQIRVADETGFVFARIDLGYRLPKIAIEYDGEDYHASPEQRASDEARDAKLRDLGWIIIRIDRERLRTAPWSIIIEIDKALRSRGCYY
ncbi:endonuclease domain-containing protein [Gordonia rhizosphera]|uniref:Restriction endonuclease type II-like domain-containing protein n=1 Tax=Gordonia rhizosphera NBRC 16068 TaxID=1108045 RepID=K6W9S8_9ACTN|nr:hypothetical protein [Gordonia rhizosphera]GAB90521.1 hypothetical protein GORHZ_104_00510 [Gordonia rhizosphera NBRC 16068]